MHNILVYNIIILSTIIRLKIQSIQYMFNVHVFSIYIGKYDVIVVL